MMNSKKGSILLYTRYRAYMQWLPGFMQYFKSNGIDVYHVNSVKGAKAALEALIPKMDHVFIWNGNGEVDGYAYRVSKEHDIPYTFLESGFFPQKKYYTMDRKGVNAKSFLIDDTLDWVTQSHLNKLDSFRQGYFKGRRYNGGGGYVLAPLQLEGDSSIQLHSPYKTMQAFIDHVEEEFPDKRIQFKAHPRDKNATSYQVNERNTLLVKADFLELAESAELVYGINSTTLLEAALLGAPVVSIGDGFLKSHKDQVEKILAAIIDMQIPIHETDLNYWVENYSSFAGSSNGKFSQMGLKATYWIYLIKKAFLALKP